jgi:hypothetical protein
MRNNQENAMNAQPNIQIMMSVFKWVVFTAFGLFVILIVLGLGGYQVPFWPEDTEVTNDKPFSTYIGQGYRVTNNIKALAWNDFPDKEKILVVSLMPPIGAQNRFVSYSITLQTGQKIGILSAWRSLSLFEYTYYYLVSIPDAGLPENVPIKMKVNSDGIPSPLFYESLQSNKGIQADALPRAADASR